MLILRSASKRTIKITAISCLSVIFAACATPEEQIYSFNNPPTAKLMEMERRNKGGDLIGLNEEGLWYKREEKNPYSGYVAGHYKAKEGNESVMASVREYKNGVQVGVETSYYSNGNKHIELIYENRKVVSMRQWSIDGRELE